ncbi:protein EI24 homolog [Aristolochia californica]|uniref:protein EI24 homolog n=1 Tax=Aristolochia californica TaxID=171875 RepID=UPI0035D92E53
MDEVREYVKHAGILWQAGFREACCLHRVVFFCRRSRMLSIRTGQCFLLNGLIFLGSMYILNFVVMPTLWWILPDGCQNLSSKLPCWDGEPIKLYTFLRYILIELFYVLWFYPLYVFSLCLSTIWYNDIAKHAFSSMETSRTMELSKKQQSLHMEKSTGIDKVMFGISEQLYSLLLLSIFCFEVYATGLLPYVGNAIKFLLLSWMYAYYCFEYKWNFIELELVKRLDFFESNWAFFAGFGSPCVMGIFFFSPLLSYGVMAILFPLFVLTAIGSQAEKDIDSQRRSWGGGPGKLPIFYVANILATRLL